MMFSDSLLQDLELLVLDMPEPKLVCRPVPEPKIENRKDLTSLSLPDPVPEKPVDFDQFFKLPVKPEKSHERYDSHESYDDYIRKIIQYEQDIQDFSNSPEEMFKFAEYQNTLKLIEKSKFLHPSSAEFIQIYNMAYNQYEKYQIDEKEYITYLVAARNFTRLQELKRHGLLLNNKYYRIQVRFGFIRTEDEFSLRCGPFTKFDIAKLLALEKRITICPRVNKDSIIVITLSATTQKIDMRKNVVVHEVPKIVFYPLN